MIKKIFGRKKANVLLLEEEELDNHRGLISLRNIHKSYQTAAGEFPVLKGIDADFFKGEFVAVIGKSGSGKSTLINMITGIDHPTSGEVLVGDTFVHKLNENQMSIWRGRNLGIVFQFFQLLPTLSLVENIMLPMDFCNMYAPRQRKERALELLRQVEMEEHADKLPSAISGGQQQRVAIARALANDPPILIADEPTGNLDSKTAEAVFKMFADLINQEKTIVMVTHDSSLAKRVHRTLLLADGEVVNEWVARALPTLTHQQMLEATHKIEPCHFAPGQDIIVEDQPGDNFYIVTKGNVEVSLKLAGGNDVIVAHYGPGEFFGEIEAYRGKKAIATIRAGVTPVEVITFDRETFLNLLSESEPTKKTFENIIKERERENISTRRKR